MKHHESNLQIQCVRWFRYTYPKLLIYSVPNGGIRTQRNARTLKAEGALAGVADLVVVNGKGEHLYLEMKTPKGRQSETQKAFEEKCKTLNVPYKVIRSGMEFMAACQKFCE